MLINCLEKLKEDKFNELVNKHKDIASHLIVCYADSHKPITVVDTDKWNDDLLHNLRDTISSLASCGITMVWVDFYLDWRFYSQFAKNLHEEEIDEWRIKNGMNPIYFKE